MRKLFALGVLVAILAFSALSFAGEGAAHHDDVCKKDVRVVVACGEGAA